MQPEKTLRTLASTISSAIQSSPDVLKNRVVEVPDISSAEFLPTSQCGVRTPPHAYRFVEDFLSSDHQNPLQKLVEQFRATEDLLIWGQAPGYHQDNVGQAFLDNYCHALLTGPDGPLKCSCPLGAFVLFGPETLYRDHSHAPNEVYLALTDGGEWRVEGHPWKTLTAGQTIFIPAHAVHAIRTGSRPLLTFSFWLDPGDMESIDI